MDLLDNPFHILGVSPSDNRRRIIEVADECSLLRDPNECMESRSVLTNPRKRLSAEISWLPGTAVDYITKVLELLESSPEDVLHIEDLTSIARCNLLAAAITRLDDCHPDELVTWVLEIADEFEEVSPGDLGIIVNEERAVSRFPEITDLSTLEMEVQERRRHYNQVIKSAFNKLSAGSIVKAATAVVESSTQNGEEPGAILIADFVASYEVDAQEFFEKEVKNIMALVNRLRKDVDAKCSDSILNSKVDQLISIVKNWDTVAQPIQVSAKGQGFDHDDSEHLAEIIRRLSIHMVNQHNKVHLARKLTDMLQEVFAEVDKVAEQTAEDSEALGKLADQAGKFIDDLGEGSEEWDQTISYEAKIGIIFRNRLRISADGIEWKGRCWKLASITRIRWGSTVNVVNGVAVGTTYTIFFGTTSDYVNIELKKEAIYSNFTECLWKAVGVRLMVEYLKGCHEGEQYQFGSSTMSDDGMALVRKRLFLRGDRIFCHWDELEIWNDNGALHIAKKEDKRFVVVLSYLAEDNIHLLEAALQMRQKLGVDRLSGLLGL